MFFDEEMLLDLRLNVLDKYVDKFVITEASYMHSGKPKKLNFNINKFHKFKDKIIYKVIDEQPKNIIPVKPDDDERTKEVKLINNSNKREHFQREMIINCIKEAANDDYIIISDVDEIPNLNNINFEKNKKRLICFKQKMFYYKFNLLYEKIVWHGSRACKKKYLISPQWLRDTKSKKYPIWRFDIFFSKSKYNSIDYVENGGWHFVNIKTPEEIEKKLKNFGHHWEYQVSGLNLKDIKNMVNNKRAVYDYHADMKSSKWSGEEKLSKCDFSELPTYLRNNKERYSRWID